MSTSLRHNGTTGFKFSRPTIGRIGATDKLHPYVELAVEALVARVKAGLPAPPARAAERINEIEADARASARAAEEAQAKSDRGARAVDEAYEEHAKLEDIAERRLAEYTEAARANDETGSQSAKQSVKGAANPVADLKKLLDESRRDAQNAANALETIKMAAADLSDRAVAAAEESHKAAKRADDARRAQEEAVKRLADILALDIFSQDAKAKTLLAAPVGRDHMPLTQLIDNLGLTAKSFEVNRLVQTAANRLPFNVRTLLSKTEVVEYLFAQAVLVNGLDEPESIFNAIIDADRGGRVLYAYVTAFALVEMRDTKRMAISDDAMTAILERLNDAPVSLRHNEFDAALRSLSAEFVYGDAELGLVLHAEQALGMDIPTKLQPVLVDYIRRSNAGGQKINSQNAPFFVANALSRLHAESVPLRPAQYGPEVDVEDYSVSYYEDRVTAPEYERASIEAAAQMYLTMVWGDMLGVFATVDRIGMQSSGNGQPLLLEVRSRQLSNDLRSYVLDEEFVDLKTGKLCKRISPTERQMLYRQLFGIGNAQVIDDSHVNPDFQRYWAVLMMEVAKYIGKVEDSGVGYTSISASKVYQAIEDLQYNLSAYCTGLPKIAAPAIYGELDFVIQRILDSTDVKQQIGRRGAPSFWKVVEQVRGMQDFTPLRNKGMFGHKILSTIAQATPAFIEDQAAFEDFIATVEAFIVAEDQLAESGGSMAGLQFPGFYGADGIGPGAGAAGGRYLPGMPSGLPGMPGNMFMGGGNARSNGPAATDDWNF